MLTTDPHLDRIPAERWSYLAGLFMGEGCFELGDQRGVPTFKLKIAVCDEAAMQDLLEFGGAVGRAGRKGTGNRLQNEYAWRVADGYQVVELVRRILPLMCGTKHQQGRAFLKFARYKLRCWERRQRRGEVSYRATELLRMYQLALLARMYAGGASKEWRARWRKHIIGLRRKAPQ